MDQPELSDREQREPGKDQQPAAPDQDESRAERTRDRRELSRLSRVHGRKLNASEHEPPPERTDPLALLR